MIRNNIRTLILSSIVILLPMLIGFILWDILPDSMTIHWGASGNADGWGAKHFVVIVLPLILLVLQWICVFFTAKDNKNRAQSEKVYKMVLWIVPLISLLVFGIIYSFAFGKEFDVAAITFLLMGLMFVVIGNYMPKCKQNYTIGIKIKWTLQNEENWNATHRFSGRVWVIGGLVFMASVFLPEAVMFWVLMPALIVLVVLPFVYSYKYHKKQLREGTAATTPLPKSQKTATIWALIVTAAILIFVGVLCFTGDIEIKYGDTDFAIEADYYGDLSVSYDKIDSVEYRDEFKKGIRVGGFGSSRLSMGNFKNEEFGNYTLYAYTRCDPCVILTSADGKKLVINGADEESTKAIYSELLKRK